jgi:O-antigen/teichoic acid export membrane protein
MHILKKLARQTVLYGLSSIIGRLLNYLLVPLYTSILLPSEYGIVTEFYAYAALGNIIYTFGLETAYFRFATHEKSKNHFNVAMSLLLISSVLFSVILILFATPLSHWLHYPGHERYIYYLAVILTTDTLLTIPFAQLRLHNRLFSFTTAKLVQITFTIGFNVLLLYAVKTNNILARTINSIIPCQKIECIFIANLLANAAVLPWFRKTFSAYRFQLPKKTIKLLFAYAFPLLLMGLAGTANEMLSRILLKYLLPPGFYPGYSQEDVLGILNACYKLAVLMNLVNQTLRYAGEPFFFTHAQDKESPQVFSQIMHAYIIVACFTLLAITANLDWLSYLFLRNPVYRIGIELIPYLAFAYLWLGIYYNLSIWFKLTDKTYYGTLLTGLGVCITVSMNIVLVPYWGYWGSVWSIVTSYISMSVLSYYQGKRYYPIPYQISRGLVCILSTLVLIPILRNITYTSWISNIMTNLGITFLLGLLFYWIFWTKLKIPSTQINNKKINT